MRGSKTTHAMLMTAIVLSACFGDFHLSASNLQVGPNPAVPGDVVQASFFLSLAPLQRHTVRVMIDERQHAAITSTEQPPAPYLITLGKAADLIATYGAGPHTLRIEVRADDADRTARTQAIGFELRQSTP